MTPDLRGLTLKHLRAHEATVRHGSVTAAARELLVTPPAITSQLKLLEAMVGAPIYDRAQEGFMPTELGCVLLEMARDVDRLVTKAQVRLAALKAGASGAVVFGAVSTAKYIAPRIVAAFREAQPAISVKLMIGNRSEILRGIDHYDYDVVLMGRPPEHVPIQQTLLGDHPHLIIAAPTHPLAAREDLDEGELAGELFLLREPGSGTRLLNERLFARIAHQRAVHMVEMGTNETIKQAVMAGLGVSFISAHTCISELAEGKLVALRVRGMPVMRQWYLMHRTDRAVSRATEVFEAFVLANAPVFLPAPK